MVPLGNQFKQCAAGCGGMQVIRVRAMHGCLTDAPGGGRMQEETNRKRSTAHGVNQEIPLIVILFPARYLKINTIFTLVKLSITGCGRDVGDERDVGIAQG